ncbi:MAG: hypothetical protein KF777_01635 [Planctomycetaceae bacterium]|nr:hypothetical protein [Planctomycetaceae bacterium]
MQDISASLLRSDNAGTVQLGFNGAFTVDAMPRVKQVWMFLGFNDGETTERIHVEAYLTLDQVDGLIDELQRQRRDLVASLLAKEPVSPEATPLVI